MSSVVIWPAKVLSTPTQPVLFAPRACSVDLHALVERMKKVMAEEKGVGLAANQIGQPWRVCIVEEPGVREVIPAAVFAMVNPEIVARRGEVVLDEGCLSVPNEFEKVLRSVEVDVRFQDVRGEWVTTTAKGKLAHIIQHEVDHLDGIVFTYHLGALKRGLIRERMMRLKRERA
jgi:peptide deformylase